MSDPSRPDEATFLSALADRIGTRLIVFVPMSRRPRSFWLGPVGPADEIERVADLGRTWLSTRSADSVDLEETDVIDADSAVGAAVVYTAPGTVHGALVVAKHRDGIWTAAERALLRFAADYFTPSLIECVRRPRPEAGLHPRTAARRSRADFASGIRSAAGNGELFVVYQPEVDLDTGEIVAVEALVRWQHPEYGELAPDTFIALAEESDLIKVLGAWIVTESLREFSGWTDEIPGLDVVLRVNASPSQLTDNSLVDLISSALAERGIPGRRLCVEITENFKVQDVERVRTALGALRALGVTSALDDFAAGFSSLARLRALPIDAVKIDRSVVAEVDTDTRARAIVRSVLGLAGELGLDVIAEGVERAEEAATLRELGCRRAQGHHFGRPVPAEQMQLLLTATGRKISG